MKGQKVIISGGGTGGHVYPGLAVGRKLGEKAAGLGVTFIGTSRPVEKNIIERYGVSFIPLRVEGLKGKGLKSIKSLLILPWSFLKSLWILLKIRPDLVIGVGGYSSGPIVLLASLLRIPTVTLEQNARPGLTNRLLRPWVRKAVVAFKSTLPQFRGKGVFLGNPVREEFYTLKPKTGQDRLAVLIFGGSQGSHFLNRALVSSLPLLREEKERLIIFHQTGEKDCSWVKGLYLENGFADATVAAYFHNMADYFEKADLVICRAGATTIAELIVARKAAILVPFAGASENHQEWNARELENAGGAEVVLEAEFSPEFLAARIRSFLQDRSRITRLAGNLAALQTERPAEKIADLCLELIGVEL